MKRPRGRTATAKKGFIPGILDYADVEYMDTVLDCSVVEYGTGCWVYEHELDMKSHVAQQTVFKIFHGDVPDGHFVYNVCSDYRVCYNPHCLTTAEGAGNEDEA